MEALRKLRKHIGLDFLPFYSFLSPISSEICLPMVFRNFYGSITEALETIFQQNVEDLDKFTPRFCVLAFFLKSHETLWLPPR